MEVTTGFTFYSDCVDFNHKLAEKIEEGVYVISYHQWVTTIRNGGHIAIFSSQAKPTSRQLRRWKKQVYKV